MAILDIRLSSAMHNALIDCAYFSYNEYKEYYKWVIV